MIEVPLEATPNQAFEIMLEGSRYTLAVRAAGEIVSIDVDRDGVAIIAGHRAQPDYLVLPYPHLAGGEGNFIFETGGTELPDWRKFGETHFLFYVEKNELA